MRENWIGEWRIPLQMVPGKMIRKNWGIWRIGNTMIASLMDFNSTSLISCFWPTFVFMELLRFFYKSTEPEGVVEALRWGLRFAGDSEQTELFQLLGVEALSCKWSRWKCPRIAYTSALFWFCTPCTHSVLSGVCWWGGVSLCVDEGARRSSFFFVPTGTAAAVQKTPEGSLYFYSILCCQQHFCTLMRSSIPF